jgi:hypothetical protein
MQQYETAFKYYGTNDGVRQGILKFRGINFDEILRK